MRQSPLISGLLAPLQFAVQPALLIALLLHAAMLAIPFAAESEQAEETASEAETATDDELAETADFPPLEGMPGEAETLPSPANSIPPLTPRATPTLLPPTPGAKIVPRASQTATAARRPVSVTSRAAVTPRQPVNSRSSSRPAGETQAPTPTPSEMPTFLEPLPPPDREEVFRSPSAARPSPSNPFASLPIYASETSGRALAGSLRLLQPELDRDAFNTPDTFEEVLETYPDLLARVGVKLDDDPELEEDGFQVHRLTAEGGGAEPRYLHLIRHYHRTVLVVAPEPLTRPELERRDTSTEDDQQALERILNEIKTAYLGADLELGELERFGNGVKVQESCTLQGETRDRAHFPARDLQRQLHAELASSDFYSRENRHYYPGARLYTVMNRTKTFTRYLILTPVQGDRGTAILACRELPGYVSARGR